VLHVKRREYGGGRILLRRNLEVHPAERAPEIRPALHAFHRAEPNVSPRRLDPPVPEEGRDRMERDPLLCPMRPAAVSETVRRNPAPARLNPGQRNALPHDPID